MEGIVCKSFKPRVRGLETPEGQKRVAETHAALQESECACSIALADLMVYIRNKDDITASAARAEAALNARDLCVRAWHNALSGR